MPYKHVIAPTKGIKTDKAPTVIPKEYTPYCKGVYMRNGEVRSDYGYTQFPTRSATQTNKLAGKVMMLDQFYVLSGLAWLIGITTSNVYTYNEASSTWDCITPGVTVDDCESVWSASLDVVTSADGTYKLKGTYSAKSEIADAFGTGLASYHDIASIDLSGYTSLHFWIRSSVDTSAGDLQVVLDDTSGSVSPLESLDVPALIAGEWTAVCVNFVTPSALTAIISVGLNVVTDLGAMDVYLDDLRAVNTLTGDVDNRFSAALMNDTYIFTNGIDQPKKITAVGSVLTVEDLSTTLASGSIASSELVFSFRDHLFLMNNIENSASCPQRVSWTNVGSIEDWTEGTAGYQDLVDDASWIVAVEELSANEFVVYKERSIIIGVWVGGATPFRFRSMVTGTGALTKDSVMNVGGEHICLGPDVIFSYKGGTDTDALDDNIKRTLYADLNQAYALRSFLVYVEEDDELQVWIPTTDEYPDDVWCINMVDENWYRRIKTMTGFGYYQRQSSLTIGQLQGSIGEQDWRIGSALTKAYAPITLLGSPSGEVFYMDKFTLNNDGSAITNVFDTPDFELPSSEEFMDNFMRVPLLSYEAIGQSVTTLWSDDGGVSWNPTEGKGMNVQSLEGVYHTYQQYFDVVCKKIRFRFMNSDESSGFKMRSYAVEFNARSRR